MSMSKKWLRIIPLLMALMFVLVGCNTTPANDQNDTKQTNENNNVNDTNGNDNDDMTPNDNNDTNDDRTPNNNENKEDIIEEKKDVQDPDNKDE